VGQSVVAEIKRYPDVADGPLEAEVLKVLGDPDDPRTEVEKVLACADVTEQFPPPVAHLAEVLPREVRPPSAPTAPISGTSSSRRSIPRRRATSTTPSPSRSCRVAARACGSPSPTSRTTCVRARPSTSRRSAAA